jgi:hypothetical protein
LVYVIGSRIRIRYYKIMANRGCYELIAAATKDRYCPQGAAAEEEK